jgi:hypothetical protein
MKRCVLVSASILALTVFFLSAQEMNPKNSTIAGTPQWEKLKSLVGDWDGYTEEGGKKIPVHITVRMTGDGSALMHWMGAGTPHEMITMFHMDKSDLLATHYCAAHNQPRFRAVSTNDPSKVAFEFKDGTNIRPGDGYMRQLVISFIDADHHDETWGYDMNGKVQPATFSMTRTKGTAKH